MAHILVVDDEEGIRLTLEIFLSDEGHSVSTACGLKEAVSMLSLNDFDLIFADLSLSDGTGIDILREVRQRNLRTTVVVITGFPDIDSASEAVRLGAFEYLLKPVTQEKLLHITGMALRNKALVDEKEKCRANLEAIFRSVKDSIITVDQEGRVVEINDAALRMCGFRRESIVGQAFSEISSSCRGKCIEILNEAMARRELVESHRFECWMHGRPRYIVNLTACPLLDPQGAFSGVVLVIKDETRISELESELEERQQYHRIIGKSAKMQKVYAMIDALASINTSVLITGESGTGKELVAEALHYMGLRGGGPLVKVNCAALPESILESELFGHVKGAFTGAVRDRIGRFQKAQGGTILLDEIGDLSPKIQLDLLRVIQEKEFERVGDSIPVKIDARIIAATNKNLLKKVALGEFREDLYYRLKVVEINLPPLRERREDIPVLVDYFLFKFQKAFNKDITAVSSDVLEVLLSYSWPGNVRELEHAIEHAFVTCTRNTITIDNLPPELTTDCSASHHPDATDGDEAHHILHALEKSGWNKAKAARLLGMDRKTLYRKLWKLNIPVASQPCR